MTQMPSLVWRSAVSVFMLVSISIPTGVHAGILSGVVGFFSSTFAYTTDTTDTYNSQTFPLPEPAQHVDPNPAKGGGDITIVNDSALLPASGPSGSLADLEETGIPSKHSGRISIYIVREGDTLSTIADMFDVSVNTIRWSNDIARDTSIQPGQELVILPVSGIKYTVKTGGSLRDIIELHGGSLEEAVAFNGYGADEHLDAGTEVIIPDGEIAAPKQEVRVAQTRYQSTSMRAPRASVPELVGYFLRPVVGGVRTQGLHGYNAVDLAAPVGTPILASASGRVIISKGSGWNGGYGKYVVIEHPNGTQTLYAHNSQNIVFSGQDVVQGQVIAYMGSTGRSTGSHVHFEVRGAKNPF